MHCLVCCGLVMVLSGSLHAVSREQGPLLLLRAVSGTGRLCSMQVDRDLPCMAQAHCGQQMTAVQRTSAWHAQAATEGPPTAAVVGPQCCCCGAYALMSCLLAPTCAQQHYGCIYSVDLACSRHSNAVVVRVRATAVSPASSWCIWPNLRLSITKQQIDGFCEPLGAIAETGARWTVVRAGQRSVKEAAQPCRVQCDKAISSLLHTYSLI
jgi:hypothetical protein